MTRRKRKKNTRKKKGGKIMSSIKEQKSTKIDCTKNKIDERDNCYLGPISLECLKEDNVIKLGTDDNTCFDKTQFCTYAKARGKLPINNPVTNLPLDINLVKDLCPELKKEEQQPQEEVIRRRLPPDVIRRRQERFDRKMRLIRNYGSYRVPGPYFWTGDESIEGWEDKPCCSKCEPHGCMSYLGCGENKCTPCDENLQPGRGQKRCTDTRGRRGGKRKSRRKRRKKKTRKKRKTKKKKKTKKNIVG